MKNTTIVLSAALIAAAISCTNSAPRRPTGTTGAAGTVAPSGTAGTTVAAAGTNGAAGDGSAQGTAGTAAAGTIGGTAGTAAAGTTGAAGDGSAGTAAAGTTGAAGDGSAGTAAAGTVGAAGDSGAAGTAAAVCNNATVVTAGGLDTNCPAKTGWKATAMPTPNKGFDGIVDSQLLPQYAIDGDSGTRYSSGATAAAGFYFQVDMGAAKMVSGITVTETAATDTSNGYKVEVSTNGTDFTMVVAMCTSMASASEVINFAAVNARYVRYTNENPRVGGDTSWWSIHEFDIFCNN